MPRRRRRSLVAIGVVALLAVAVPALAQSAFRDVAAGSTHHRAIERIRAAGVTLGCAAGDRFCPRDFVTRDQMASFLSRSGGMAFADRSATTLTAGSGNVNGVAVTVDVQGQGERPGRQNLVVTGTVTVHHQGALDDCPCEVEAFIYRARDERQGPSAWGELSGEVEGSATTSVSLPVTWTLPVDAGRSEQLRLAVFVEGTTVGGIRADGALTAVTVPYGSVPTG